MIEFFASSRTTAMVGSSRRSTRGDLFHQHPAIHHDTAVGSAEKPRGAIKDLTLRFPYDPVLP